MNCKNCGAELAPDAKFCADCGQSVEQTPVVEQPEVPVQEPVAPVTETVEPAQEAAAPAGKLDFNAIKSELVATVAPIWQKVKPVLTNKKVLLGIGAGLALILVIGIISAILTSGNGFTPVKQTTLALHNGNEISIIVDNKVLSDTIESDSNPADSTSSLDGKVTALLTEEGELYVINGKKVVKVDEDVEDYSLSATGKGLAYIVEGDDDDSLMLYTVSSKKSVEITDEVSSYNFAISPDGKSVVYKVEDEDDEDVMYFNGKESTKLTSDDATILGLSNGGKYIYISIEKDDEDVLYSYNKKGDRENLGKLTSVNVRFNDDHTQIMFYNEEKTYISNKAKDAEKASSDQLRLLLAPNSSYTTSGYGTTYPVSSLFDHVYVGDDAWLLKKNADKNVKLVSDVSDCTLDESAEYLYYIEDGEELKVLQISKGEKAADKAVTLAEEVDNYVVTSNRKKVYFINDETLYSVNGIKGGKARRITNGDVESYSLALNAKDVCYYVMDDNVYACSNGKKGTKVVSDAMGVSGSNNGVVYVICEDSLYTTKTSKKPKQVLEIDFG